MSLFFHVLRKYPLLVISIFLLAANASLFSQPAQSFSQNQLSPPPSSNKAIQVSSDESAYTLGPGDRINIDIFQVPQYSGQQEIQVDGTLNLSLVGNVQVNSLTLDEAERVLTSRYAQFLRNPRITVSLTNRRPLQVGIAGEVNRPGTYVLNSNGAQSPRLTQLLDTAGGITQVANVRQVAIRRFQPDGTSEVITANLWQLLQTGDLNYDISLRDGDSIFIPTTSTNLDEAPLLATASFATNAQPINIAVIGEVYQPGPYISGGGGNSSTVTRAIQTAGGIKPQADVRNVQVIRATRSGTSQIIEVNLWDLIEAGDLRQDAILQDGDTIFIPTASEVNPLEVPTIASASFSPDSIRVNIVGEVENPGTRDLIPNTSLSQAILSAGGFNNRANKREAALIRLNPDGTVATRSITVDFAQGIDEELNPLLRNNDIVIVDPSAATTISDGVGSVLNPIGRVLSNILVPFRFLNFFD